MKTRINRNQTKAGRCRFLLCMLTVLLLVPVGSAQAAQERILQYDSLVQINPNATVTVTETILVQSAGDQIQRGIYRDFPTTYRDKYGNRIHIDFQVLSVYRDNSPEPYSIEKLGNGLRVKIGREDVILSPGQYIYSITYTVNRMLGFFPDHDELYWNVTSNNWAFPIDSATAAVMLPAGVSFDTIMTAAYTGFRGESGEDYIVAPIDGGVIFTATRSLAPGEGLTIVAGWPKGFVPEPTSQEKLGWFFKDNLGILIVAFGLLAVLLWYLLAWFRVGRDPRKGIIIPLYAPPEEASPAAMRYLRRMGFDNKVFTAAVINLAVQGRLTIREKGKKYILANTNLPVSASPEENAVHARLFTFRDEITLINANHTVIGAAITDCKQELAKSYKGKYFKVNTLWLVPGIILSGLITAAGMVFSGNFNSLFFALWLSIWTVGTVLILKQVRSNFRQGNRRAAVGMGCFSIPFVIGWCVGFGMMIVSGGVVLTLAMAALFCINIVFAKLLKAPTYGGRRVLDEIDGFKMFLEVAEKDYLQWSAPPERTPELFEKYLPHALALDVAQQWAEKFAGVLAASSVEGGYLPVWYDGRSLTGFSAAAFSSSLSSSFNSAVASSGVAPGSSSGFSGGSSGGGGGGGGGGGW